MSDVVVKSQAAPAVQTVLLQDSSTTVLTPDAPEHLQLRLQSEETPVFVSHISAADLCGNLFMLTVGEMMPDNQRTNVNSKDQLCLAFVSLITTSSFRISRVRIKN